MCSVALRCPPHFCQCCKGTKSTAPGGHCGEGNESEKKVKDYIMITGWWLSHPSEKYESMGRIIPYIMENKKCSKPPTRLECLRISANVLSNQINEQSLLLSGHIISRLLFRIFGNSAQAGNINTATASTICYFGTCPCRACAKMRFLPKACSWRVLPHINPKMGRPKPSKTIGSLERPPKISSHYPLVNVCKTIENHNF